MGPGDLAQVFQHVDLQMAHPDLLADTRTLDDAGVFRINPETALVQTIDFFTPVVDDPFVFGQIAAANALSDVYAMGGTPITALNVVGFPITKLPHSVLAAILAGGADKVREAGAVIAGGHSIDDTDPKYGLAVTGTCHPDRFWRNVGAQAGDVLILTKPLGVGVMTTAIKRGLATPIQLERVTTVMARLNKQASLAGHRFTVHACTDITGFGLLGHTCEMATGSDVAVRIHASRVPVLEGALELAEQGVVPGGSRRNAAWLSDKVRFADTVAEPMRTILADSVTSGGLLFAIPAAEKDAMLDALRAGGDGEAACVGEVLPASPGACIEIVS